MNKTAIKNAIAVLTSQNIKPYDLLLALGEKDIVPDEAVTSREQRVQARDGKITPEGFVRNAIEDLKKLDFQQKDWAIKSLKNAIGDVSPLSGFAESNSSPSNLIFWAVVVGFLYFVYSRHAATIAAT